MNMAGEFEKPLVIGEAKQPRCFKGSKINLLGIEWHANKRAWMTREIVKEWLLGFHRKMGRQKKQVILFMDNATSHTDTYLPLENVKAVYLQPNTISACQLLDQGIIKNNFKVLYRQNILRRLRSKTNYAFSASELAMKITVVNAVMWITSSVKQITPRTVQNCFLNADVPDAHGLRGFEIVVDGDSVELAELLKEFGESAVDYASFDDVQTEDPSTDIKDLVASIHSRNFYH
ncbi:hypothetical protein PR048_003258 [Dryococelus australis]|uniref:DDE-1 domain-containing protein n=1 Tax=Dryococelus australis TaxID=614101 RepID=A0ABQ9IMI6_9NEOP|nr:hypothetical protein PR048_003258 [Dryococelus australis]